MTVVEIMASTSVTGKRRLWAIEAARAKVKAGELYLIKRHGQYFRPAAAGYTSDLSAAGVFTSDVARSHLNCEGLSVIALDSMRYAIISEIGELEAKAMRLRRMRSLTEGAGMSAATRDRVCKLVVDNPKPAGAA